MSLQCLPTVRISSQGAGQCEGALLLLLPDPPKKTRAPVWCPLVSLPGCPRSARMCLWAPAS